MDLLPRLERIFREIFDDPRLQLALNTGRADIPDWDSVAQVKLLLALEEEFQIRFDTDEASALKTVGELCQAIARHSAEGR